MSTRKPPKKPPGSTEAPRTPQAPQLSSLMDSVGGMMALPESIAKGRAVKMPPGDEPQSARSGRRSWSSQSTTDSTERESQRGLTEELEAISPNGRSNPNHRALQKSTLISLTETAVSAMPSSSRDLWVLHDRDGSFATNVRILATRISKINETYGYKSFIFTSPGTEQGKTVSVVNLALAMSEDSDRKVALLDTNFRNPRVADLFNLDNSRGLLGAVTGHYSVSESVTRVTGRNLIVMTSGGEHANPGQLMSEPAFKNLISQLSQNVDYLFIDAPPALPHADVALLSQNTDAVVMVTAKGRTKAGMLNQAISAIGAQKIVGTVFVDIPGSKKRS